ncbi:MAG: efflux RND transporter periplasmic adaptor subunit [Deltaproteobacteria bacterium]|nr:efflux RND transporter periplasmic adaptor subunit [Deltaproteobacteria bacterium]
MNRSKLRATASAVTIAALAAGSPACKPSSPSNAPVAAAAAKAGTAAPSRKYPVEIAVAKSEPLVARIEATGGVEAEDWVQVAAQVEGVLGPLAFNEGDRVGPNTALVAVDPERYRMAVAQKSAALDRAQADLDDKQAGLVKRKALREKEPGWVPEEEITTWEAQVAQRRAEVAEARAALELARLDLERATIRPPIEGVIEKREATPGQYVKPGTVVASIVRTQPIRIRFSLREAESGFVQPGDPIALTVPAYPTEVFRGEVFFVARSADPSTRRVEVLARNANADERLKPGFFAQVSIERGTNAEAILLPESALFATEDGFVGWVVEDGKARKRVVRIGVQTADGRIEVKEGIRSGETVVIKGAGSLLDGVEVVVVEGAAAPGAPPASAPATPRAAAPAKT